MKTLLTRLRSRPIASLVGVVALVLAVGFGVLALTLGGDDNTGTDFATNEVVNPTGGYRIEIPDDWTSAQDGRTTTLTSPDKQTIVTLGVGRTGPLPIAGTLFFQEVGSKYKDVVIIPPEHKTVAGKPALAYGGVGTNEQNTKIRFLAITVENQPTNWGIGVFTQANTDPKTVLPRVDKIVESFRPVPAS